MVNAAFSPALQRCVNGPRDKNFRLGSQRGANVQRKVFRVEQMFGERRAAAAPAQATGERDAGAPLQALNALGDGDEPAGDDIKHELALAQAAIARNRAELAALLGPNKARRMTRAAGELGAALKTEFERGLAQDIQDRTMLIYEACSFQDLAGQRIAKAIGIMHMVEEQLADMLVRCNRSGCAAEAAPEPAPAENGGLLSGPKLYGEAGHASQHDIDAIFN
jgi:chemotaxis protein CheZ